MAEVQDVVDDEEKKSLQGQDIDNKSLLFFRGIYSIRDHVRLNTISSTLADAWIKSIPNEKHDLATQKHDIIASVIIRLRISIFPPHTNAKRCGCGQILYTLGDNAMSWGNGCTRTKLHNSLKHMLWHLFLTDNSVVN